jgi:hypothetical protein
MPLCYWWPMRTELALQVACCATLTGRDEKTARSFAGSHLKRKKNGKHKKTAPEGAA